MRRFVLALVIACAPLAAFADDEGKVVLGHLGQTIEAAPIRANMDDNARIYYRAKEFEYLVIEESKFSQWYKVLMQNGRWGYVSAESVASLPYQVTVDKPTTASRGGSRAMVARKGLEYIGTRYVWGGNSLTGGIDCSGFVKELYEMIDVDLPRTAAQQAKVGTPITRYEDLRAGDRLYFWSESRGKIGHTGLFLGYAEDGGAYFVHSSTTHGGVATDDLRNPKWRNMLVAARR